jgi:hypothetical protein
MDATIGNNPVVARSENNLLSFGNARKTLPVQRNAYFPPATCTALRSTKKPLPKFSHSRNSHREGIYFRSEAANNIFTSAINFT